MIGTRTLGKLLHQMLYLKPSTVILFAPRQVPVKNSDVGGKGHREGPVPTRQGYENVDNDRENMEGLGEHVVSSNRAGNCCNCSFVDGKLGDNIAKENGDRVTDDTMGDRNKDDEIDQLFVEFHDD